MPPRPNASFAGSERRHHPAAPPYGSSSSLQGQPDTHDDQAQASATSQVQRPQIRAKETEMIYQRTSDELGTDDDGKRRDQPQTRRAVANGADHHKPQCAARPRIPRQLSQRRKIVVTLQRQHLSNQQAAGHIGEKDTLESAYPLVDQTDELRLEADRNSANGGD